MILAALEFSSYPQLKLFLLALACVAGASGFFWKLGRLGVAMDWLTQRKWACGAFIFVVSFVVVAMLASKRGIPGAYVHDEFSYLLASDTFAHGRLTNPTPPAWEHFETMHVLVKPSYQSKYPPGQGLFMALGQVVFGYPIVGIWICTAFAATAIWWAMRAYVSARWALLGGLIACLHPQVMEWGQRYWGGNVALLAGALLVGGSARFGKNPCAKWGAITGLGVFLLAISRPFEGMVITVLMGGATIWELIKNKPERIAIVRGFAGFFAVFLPGMIWLGYYNYRVTGSPLRLPYSVHHAQYGSAPLFIFQPPRPTEDWPKYNNPQMEKFAGDSNWDHLRREKGSILIERAVKDVSEMPLAFFENISGLAAVLLILPLVILRDERLKRMTLVLLGFGLILPLETYMFPHYQAPAGALMLALTLRCARWMWKSGGLGGRLMVRVGLTTALVGCVFWWIGFHGWIIKPANWRESEHPWFVAWKDWIEQDYLGKMEGKHLVIVRYWPDHFENDEWSAKHAAQNMGKPEHNVHDEWVYNGADLVNSKVIFARDLGATKNKELLEAFKDRTAWVIEPEDPSRLEPWKYDGE